MHVFSDFNPKTNINTLYYLFLNISKSEMLIIKKINMFEILRSRDTLLIFFFLSEYCKRCLIYYDNSLIVFYNVNFAI